MNQKHHLHLQTSVTAPPTSGTPCAGPATAQTYPRYKRPPPHAITASDGAVAAAKRYVSSAGIAASNVDGSAGVIFDVPVMVTITNSEVYFVVRSHNVDEFNGR